MSDLSNDLGLEKPSEHKGRRRSRKPKKERRLFSNAQVKLSDLLSGLPALLVALFAVSPYAWAWGGVSDRREAAYQIEANERAFKKDYIGAAVCFKRLIAFSSRNPSQYPQRDGYRYLMGLALEGAGEHSRAEAIMRSLAPEPEGSTTLAMADGWLGIRLIREKSTAARASGERHLLRFISTYSTKKNPSEKEKRELTAARDLLGMYYAENGRYIEARTYLQMTATKDRPAQLLQLSYVCRVLKDKPESYRNAELALKSLQVYAQEHPSDPVARLLEVSALAALDKYESAISLLEKSVKLVGEEHWRKSMVQVYISWSDSLAEDRAIPTRERFKIIESGLRYDPKNREMLLRLGELLVRQDELDAVSAEKTRTVFREMLASGEGLAVAHFALGTDAWKNGKKDEAKMHWEQACRVDSANPEIANNLAWVLAHQEPADPERGLGLIDKAIETTGEKSKSSALLHGTRGQILIKLRRWNEAVTELEIALKGGQNSPSIHGALAEAYSALGMKEMAAEHRKHAS